MSNLGDIHAEVQAEWSKLRACWEATRQQWRDEVGDEFERRRWQEWEGRVPTYLSALKDLEDIAQRALRETD
jgi:hypothetical protein